MRYSIFPWLFCCLSVTEALTSVNHHYTPSKASTSPLGRPTAFLGQSIDSISTVRSSRVPRAAQKMDLEEPYSTRTNQDLLQRYDVPLPRLSTQLQIPKPFRTIDVNHGPTRHHVAQIDKVLQQHGMPWKSSIDLTYCNTFDPENSQELFYMPFFEWQLQFMKDNLHNLRVIPTESRTGDDLTYTENQERGVRMITLCFASDEYRKIRMTVYDAGNRTQVFTSLWYPRETYNLPVLGTDLLQFAGGDRHLCVVDFQPIMDGGEAEHAQSYEHLLKPIRQQYPSLQGKMTKRFYDENHFFSNQMLYSRFEELQTSTVESSSAPSTLKQHPAYRDLFPAYQQYVQTHLNLIRSTTPNPMDIPKVRAGHAAYDSYSADRDPAHAMFAKVFGQSFADAFVYDVLFSHSEGLERGQ